MIVYIPIISSELSLLLVGQPPSGNILVEHSWLRPNGHMIGLCWDLRPWINSPSCRRPGIMAVAIKSHPRASARWWGLPIDMGLQRTHGFGVRLEVFVYKIVDDKSPNSSRMSTISGENLSTATWRASWCCRGCSNRFLCGHHRWWHSPRFS